LVDNMNPRRSVPVWPAFLLLALAAAVLGASWNALPPTWPIHWDAAGRVNGWARRDGAGAFGPLILGAALVVVIELAARRIRGQGAPSPAAECLRLASRDFMRAIALAMAAVLSFLALDLPLGPHLSPAILVLVCAAPIVAALLFGATRVAGAARELRRQSPPMEGYRGFYYSNPKDSRLWVPRPGGTGITVNFAHPLAWPVMLLLVGAPVALALLSTLWRR
jgi:uncharacterized membrane protein